MSDVTAAAKGKGAGKKGGGAKAAGKAAGEGAAAKADGQISRMLVRAIWVQEWSLANPEADAEARKAAWKDAREAVIEKNLKSYRRALNALTRAGVTMTLSEAAAAKSEGAGDDDNED